MLSENQRFRAHKGDLSRIMVVFIDKSEEVWLRLASGEGQVHGEEHFRLCREAEQQKC